MTSATAELGTCPFCPAPRDRLFHEDSLIVGIWDGYPVSPGHALLVPRRHVATWFEASEEEQRALAGGIGAARRAILERHRPDGLGMNLGEAAGQTVPHLHVHVIPRYRGDAADPRGGVRWVLPERAPYWKRP